MYVWPLVKDASTLAVGDQIVIVATGSNYALSTTQNNNNRGQAPVVNNSDAVTFGDDVQIITLKEGTTLGTWAFYTGSGYLYAASSSSNHLKTQTTNNANGSWKVTIEDGVASIVAQGTNTRNQLKYNSTSSLFSCYADGQIDVAIYRQEYNANITSNQCYFLKLNNNDWYADDAQFAAWLSNANTGQGLLIEGFQFETKEGVVVENTLLFYLDENHIKDYLGLDEAINFTHMTFFRLSSDYEFDYTVKPTEKVLNTIEESWCPGVNYHSYDMAEDKWKEDDEQTALDRVEVANGIGYAYGVVSAEGAIEVYNVNGAVVARGNNNVDLRGLGRGVYIIRTGNQVRKVVR